MFQICSLNILDFSSLVSTHKHAVAVVLKQTFDAWHPRILSQSISPTSKKKLTAKTHLWVPSCSAASSSPSCWCTLCTYAPTAATPTPATPEIPMRRYLVRRGLIPPPSTHCRSSRTAQLERSRARGSAQFAWAFFKRVIGWRFCPPATTASTRTVSISGSGLARVVPFVEVVSSSWLAESPGFLRVWK